MPRVQRGEVCGRGVDDERERGGGGVDVWGRGVRERREREKMRDRRVGGLLGGMSQKKREAKNTTITCLLLVLLLLLLFVCSADEQSFKSHPFAGLELQVRVGLLQHGGLGQGSLRLLGLTVPEGAHLVPETPPVLEELAVNLGTGVGTLEEDTSLALGAGVGVRAPVRVCVCVSGIETI